jgi:hypothetical protein
MPKDRSKDLLSQDGSTLGRVERQVDTFKQIGDVAVQYDPAHAALPWAGIRFLLQVRQVALVERMTQLKHLQAAVNDSNKFALVIEGLARVAELICRYAVIEALYIRDTSGSNRELERAVVKLYAGILSYLSRARQFFEEGTTS